MANFLSSSSTLVFFLVSPSVILCFLWIHTSVLLPCKLHTGKRRFILARHTASCPEAQKYWVITERLWVFSPTTAHSYPKNQVLVKEISPNLISIICLLQSSNGLFSSSQLLFQFLQFCFLEEIILVKERLNYFWSIFCKAQSHEKKLLTLPEKLSSNLNQQNNLKLENSTFILLVINRTVNSPIKLLLMHEDMQGRII